MLSRTVIGGLMALSLSACSESSSGAPTGEPEGDAMVAADATTAGGEVTFPDVATPEIGGPEEGPGLPAAGILRTAYISANSYQRGQADNGSLTAQFLDQTLEMQETTETFGDCTFSQVAFSGGGGGLTYYDAGSLHLAGGLGEHVLERHPAGYYAPLSIDEALWDGGEALVFTATGGTLPGFQAVVTAPSHVDVTAPPFVLGTNTTIDRSADLAVTWNGTSAGHVEVRIGGPQPAEGPAATITCAFAADAGSGTVPAGALSLLDAGSGTLGISVVSATEVDVPGWGRVSIRADVAAFGATAPGRFVTGVAFE